MAGLKFTPAGKLLIVLLVFYGYGVLAAELSINSGVNTEMEYNDNLFLDDSSEVDVTVLKLIPSYDFVLSDVSWSASLKGVHKLKRYSVSQLDTNDLDIVFDSRYQLERTELSLLLLDRKISNSNIDSDEFGITSSRVNRSTQRYTAGLSYSLSRRSMLAFNYSHDDVSFESSDPLSGLLPYMTDSLAMSYSYNLGLLDVITLSLSNLEYESENGGTNYTSNTLSVAYRSSLSETTSIDISVGVTRRDTDTSIIRQVNFFGQNINQIINDSSTDRNLALDASITRRFYKSSISATARRTEQVNSFGGVNLSDTVNLKYNAGLTELWDFSATAELNDLESINSIGGFSDRRLTRFRVSTGYKVSENLKAEMSLRRLDREFTSASDTTASSNSIFFNLKYKFKPVAVK